MRAGVFVILASVFVGNVCLAAKIQNVDRTAWKTIVESKSCDIKVAFGSYCCGTDRETFGKVKAYVEESHAITEAIDGSWGREGEHTLCLKVAPTDQEVVYEKIKSLIPVVSERAWTEIAAPGKPTFRTENPRRKK